MKHMTPLVPCLLLLFAGPARAADPFEHPASGEVLLRSVLSRPAAQLEKSQWLKGEFHHARHLREIPRPLEARGEFIFVRGLGVYWHTRQPFDSLIVLTDSGMLQSDEGAPPTRVSADEQPAVRLIASIFSALFTLDVRSLEDNFELYGVNEGTRWAIGLRPRSGAIASVLRQVTAEGANEVEQVVLTDAQGERTVIDLSGIRYSSDAPAAEVRALFAPR